MKKKSISKRILLSIIIFVVIIILILVSYVLYVVFSYHRIGNQTLDVSHNSQIEKVKVNETLTMTSYNIGFGAYDNQFTFFMDTGIDKDGNPTQGKYGKAVSKENVEKNIAGSLEVLKGLNSDFIALQEVDEDSSRAYHVNQRKYFEDAFSTYDSTFAIDFDSAYLFYPIFDPHGKSLAGLSTFSKYKIDKSNRIEYTVADDFSKYLDLDRCFSANHLTCENGKEFVFINSHMSAYDEGGKIRDKQLEELYSYMKTEEKKGNYVICCGDFNHDFLTNNPKYPQYTSENYAYKDQIDQQKPSWVNYIFNEDGKSYFDDGFEVYAADNTPSCRDCDVVYQEGSTFVSTLDGFIVSKNVSVEKVLTTKVGTGFLYSDHQPTTLTFKLI